MDILNIEKREIALKKIIKNSLLDKWRKPWYNADNETSRKENFFRKVAKNKQRKF